MVDYHLQNRNDNENQHYVITDFKNKNLKKPIGHHRPKISESIFLEEFRLINPTKNYKTLDRVT